MNENHIFLFERNWGMSEGVIDIYLEAMRDINFETHMAAYQASLGDRPSEESRGYEVDQNGVAHFKVEGPITKKMSSMQSMFGGCSSIQLARAFDRAGMDPTVKGAHLVFDTPGGAISGLTTAEAAMQRFRKKKPIVGYVDGLCASAGMWLASQCDLLYGDPSAIAGHIGVYTTLTDTSERMQKEGVKRIVVKSSEGKGAGTPGTPITDDQIADVKKEVDTFHAMFEKAIVNGRGMKPDKVSAIADGRGYIGEEAVRVGLLDGIKDQQGSYKALLKLIEDRSKPDSNKEKQGMADEEKETAGFGARLMAFLKGEGVQADAPVAATPDPKVVALELQVKTLQDQVNIRAEAEKTMAQTRNEETMQAYAEEGKFTAANLAMESALRASNPEAYDAIWKSRPVMAEFGGPVPKPKVKTVDASKIADDLLKVGATNAIDDKIRAQVRASVGKKDED